MTDPDGFHAKDGWYFRREPTGGVRILSPAAYGPGSGQTVVLDESTWASAVASVSVHGESAESFAAARQLHGGGGLNFGQAIAALRAGRRVARTSWTKMDTWLVLVPGSTIDVAADRPLGKAAPELVGMVVPYRPHIDLHEPSGVVPWVAGQNDVLAEDWTVIR